MTQPRWGYGLGVGDIPPQGSVVAATLGYGTESRWDSATSQTACRCGPHRHAREERETVMNTPVKWLAGYWKLEKEAGKMLGGPASQ
jgi:hypothetical protein